MGAWINFTNHIHISYESHQNGVMKFVGYNDITPEIMEEIVQDQKIKWIQISQEFPEKAYQVIDNILAKRPDLYFRILIFMGIRHLTFLFLGRCLIYQRYGLKPTFGEIKMPLMWNIYVSFPG